MDNHGLHFIIYKKILMARDTLSDKQKSRLFTVQNQFNFFCKIYFDKTF